MTLADRLLAVVAADDAIVQAKRLRDTGRMHYTRSAWRGLYAARERADRELWGTHADDRAQVARAILAALDAAEAQGYARAMGDAAERVMMADDIRCPEDDRRLLANVFADLARERLPATAEKEPEK